VCWQCSQQAWGDHTIRAVAGQPQTLLLLVVLLLLLLLGPAMP
jgi:hypothetical protein